MDIVNNVNLKENGLKNINIVNIYPKNTKNKSPQELNSRNSYNTKYINNNVNKNFNFRNTNINYTNIENLKYKKYFNTSNNFYPSNPRNYNNKQNDEQEKIFKKMKDLLNQREKEKVQNVLNKYYSQNYKEIINKNVDNYPNGMSLSISNCKTQYPITNIINDEIGQKMKYLLEDYENKNNNNNKLTKSNTSHQLGKNILNKNQKEKYFSNEKENYGGIYTIKREKNNFNNKYNKNLKNLNEIFMNNHKQFHSKNNLDSFVYQNNNEELNNSNNDDYININNSNIDIFNRKYFILNQNKSKLMKYYNKKRDEKKEFKRFSLYKNIKNKISGKNCFEENILLKNNIAKIKIFILCLERLFISSFNRFFKYFIEQLQLYIKSKIKIRDSINLLKRFQKTKERIKMNKNNFISNSMFSNRDTYCKELYNGFSINDSINFIEMYNNKNKYKNNIYIPKNKKNHIFLTRNESYNNTTFNNFNYNKNVDLLMNSLNISNNSKNIEKKENVSTDFNLKKYMSSDRNSFLIKRNEYYNISKYNENNSNNKKDNKNMNEQIKGIFTPNKSSSKKPKDLTFNENNFNSNQKSIIYIKPKPSNSNIKKMIFSKEEYITEKKENKKNRYINNKNFKKNSDYNLDKSEKNNNNSSFNSHRSQAKPNYLFKNENLQTIQEINNSVRKNIQGKDKKKKQKIIVKNICSYDKKLWVSVKYIVSENSLQNFNKMKNTKKLIDLKFFENTFINNDFNFLKPIHTDSIEIISPIILLNAYIENTNNNYIKEEELYKNNYHDNYKIIKMVNILQNLEKKNILYFYKFFYDSLSSNDFNQVSFSQNNIKNGIKNNIQSIDLDICNQSNEFIGNNNNNKMKEVDNIDNKKYNSNKNHEKDYNKSYLKNNLFHNKNFQGLIYQDNNLNKKIKLNKSDMDCRKDIMNEGREFLYLSESYDFSKKISSFKNNENKFKFCSKNIEDKIILNAKKGILKEGQEMMKINKLKYLLTNKFNDHNNCQRIIRNHFYIWYNDNKDFILDNNIINKNENSIVNFKIKNINEKDNNKIKEEKNDKINNFGNKIDNDKNLKLNKSQENSQIKIIRENFTLLPINNFDILTNRNANEINSIRGSKGIIKKEISKRIDEYEIKEKIAHLRLFLINYSLRMKNYLNLEG